ncbi:DNA-binding response regulator [Moraxella caviae]|uniref:DNA-binding response regulator n=1 Tax=Moraxella caviae TaxID=34060 RepID=A0A1T0A0J9_9GAMM|nr:response regulator transcription factor [Moraxella caviae]OOR89265.1 DNA-binding response regulator [Moraxella caviae]STZ13858.1 Transcriptional regulatory protein BasR [Moraxella caviae]VEW11184.1 Transcriptional regulatory protein BasR [Moraxella caviae]VEW12054.1 Transcriptional regulatory protein BasR [Moraxella caviae]
MRLLVVEDDLMIAKALMAGLKDNGYAVDHLDSGEQVLAAVQTQDYDALLLDLGLPKQDGLSVLAQIRQNKSELPILILTARDDIDSRLRGIDGGADDYIIKPFDMAELLARIRMVLRRKGGTSQPLLSNGALTLNPATFTVQITGQADEIVLSNKEFAILQALMQRAGVIFSRAQLEEKLYGWGDEVESNALDYLIHALRKKVGKEHIKNVRGVGWLVEKGV